MSLIVDEHREYLADRYRIEAYRRAIEETVRPGSVVLDLGAGSGIMGLMACRAGAKRVYSIESTDIIGLTEDICRANGFQDRVRFIKEQSTRAHLPEPVDVVVADQIGRFGFEPGISEYFSDAADRLLKPGGALIPSRIDLFVVPVSHEALWSQVEFWNTSPAGFNFQPARKMAINTGYPVKFEAGSLLSPPALLTSLIMGKPYDLLSGLEARVTVERQGLLHGIGGWFAAQLSPSVVMTNSPLAENAIRRRNVFFPIEGPVSVNPGDVVRVLMQIRPHDILVSWTVEVWGKGRSPEVSAGEGPKARSRHSTFQGMLLSKPGLLRTQPTFVPKLTPWGEARRSILELCDGKQTLEEIEREVYRRHPQLFRSPADAAQFVAEVTTRYSQ